MLLLLKANQMQAGADWDTVIAISAGLLGVACLVLLAGLVVSHLLQRSRMKKRHAGSRRRHT